MPSFDNKIFAVGDIHGCYDKLVALLKEIPFDRQKDTLVFLGDYINRGPDSRKVVETMLNLRETCVNTVFLKGNHEQLLLEYAETGDVETSRILRSMGAEATAESYDCRLRHFIGLAGLPETHREFLQNLDFSYTSSGYLFTHADSSAEMIGRPTAPTNIADAEYIAQTTMLGSRRLSLQGTRVEGFTVVFGHSPFSSPLVTADRICVDTGAVYGNTLTAVELPTLRFYHA